MFVLKAAMMNMLIRTMVVWVRYAHRWCLLLLLMVKFALLRQAFNALVDQCSIEKNCVFASKAEAEQVCLKGADGRFQVQYMLCHPFSHLYCGVAR